MWRKSDIQKIQREEKLLKKERVRVASPILLRNAFRRKQRAYRQVPRVAYPSSVSTLPRRRKKIMTSSYSFINLMKNVESALTKDKYSNRTRNLIDNFTKTMDRMFLFPNGNSKKPSHKLNATKINNNNSMIYNNNVDNNNNKKKIKIPPEVEAREIGNIMQQVKNHNKFWRASKHSATSSQSMQSYSQDSTSNDDDYLSDITSAVMKDYQIYDEIRSYDEASERKRKRKLKLHNKSSKVHTENNDGVDVRNFLPEITTAVELSDYLTYLPEYQNQTPSKKVFQSISNQIDDTEIISIQGSLTDVNLMKEPSTEITLVSKCSSGSTFGTSHKGLSYKAEWKVDKESNFLLEVTPEEADSRQIYINKILTDLEKLKEVVKNISQQFANDCYTILMKSSSPNYVIKDKDIKRNKRRKMLQEKIKNYIMSKKKRTYDENFSDCVLKKLLRNVEDRKRYAIKMDDNTSITSKDTDFTFNSTNSSVIGLFSLSFPWEKRIFRSPKTGKLIGYAKFEYILKKCSQFPTKIQTVLFEIVPHYVKTTFMNPSTANLLLKPKKPFITDNVSMVSFNPMSSWASRVSPIWAKFPEQYIKNIMHITAQEYLLKKLREIYLEMCTMLKCPLRC